ncbi:MAG: hypothetical protein PHP97_01995 [Candidatus Shapirobacteria bacterium]|nr:hypothetical protein [Candidatus Shapirobacteria bacterium]MDD3002717.1 hypothetical protein [Candidatus Shapirobacteria bacterium]MDD4382906.1 hypothetical protein [Candidatus Shapirobacteria bacterium]
MSTDPLKIAIKGSTQEHLPIEDVIDGIVIMKDGSCSTVLSVSSVNFDLLSEPEQSALVFAYGGIINSLNFPIQIIIQSHAKDVSSYLKNLQNMEEKQLNPRLKERISQYRKFIEETVKKSDILSKSFYIAITFSSLELGIKTGGVKGVKMFLSQGKSQELPFTKEYILEKAKANLEPKRDHLLRLFSRLGLEIKPLSNKEIIDLFYRTYNEETAINQKVQNVNYQAPVVTGGQL